MEPLVNCEKVSVGGRGQIVITWCHSQEWRERKTGGEAAVGEPADVLSRSCFLATSLDFWECEQNPHCLFPALPPPPPSSSIFGGGSDLNVDHVTRLGSAGCYRLASRRQVSKNRSPLVSHRVERTRRDKAKAVSNQAEPGRAKPIPAGPIWTLALLPLTAGPELLAVFTLPAQSLHWTELSPVLWSDDLKYLLIVMNPNQSSCASQVWEHFNVSWKILPRSN